jgi:hypothetical protein
MTTSKSLPTRPSQESLRKQAKRLFRDISAGNAAAIARVRAQLPNAEFPLSQRDAQRVVAREYGFAGWQDLSAEVRRRLGKGVEWALVEASGQGDRARGIVKPGGVSYAPHRSGSCGSAQSRSSEIDGDPICLRRRQCASRTPAEAYMAASR